MSNTPLDDDLHEAMSRFKAAAQAQPIELPKIEPPAKVLVAFDQSNQDDAVAVAAREVCTRFGATAVLALASPGLDIETRRKHLEAMQAKLAGVSCEISPPQDDEDPADRILDAQQAAGAKFLVLPAPYLENLDKLGRDSVGSTAERVLARATTPILFVREPREGMAGCFGKPLTKLHVRQPEAADALAVGFALCGTAAQFRVLFVVDAAAMTEAAALLGHEVDPAKLTDQALLDDAQAAAGSLVAAAQHWASDHKAALKVDFKIGSDPDVTAREANDGGHLLVLPCPADRNSSAYSRALTVLRLSSVPVLMV
ncbi:MAG: universal stress protein [Planctomycetes bacterium]|nr:universal stress protein [Planctomycetota bacterium]MCB9936128.1 universal stress protein [Planctomycetota bacterium]